MYDNNPSQLATEAMPGEKKELGIKKRTVSYIHVNPALGPVIVDSMSPVVVMKKIKLRRSDGLNQLIDQTALPELDDTLVGTPSQRGVTTDHPKDSDHESSMVHTMTLDELEDHIQKCLQMSSENKITQKNAFALQLIDCMNILVQKKKDFSTMACTLDAGAKIYSYRVDALHQQVLNLAVEVIQHQRRKQGEDAEDNDGGTELQNKLRREKTKRNVIASAETITRKMKGKDPKDRFIKVDALPGALLSTVRRDPTDLSFSLENNLPFWQNWNDYKPLKAEGMVTLPKYTIFRNEANIPSKRSDLIETDQIQPDISSIADDNVNIDDGSQQSSVSDVPMDDRVSDNGYYDETGHDQQEDIIESAAGNEVDVVSTAIQRLTEEAEGNGKMCNVPSRFEILKILFNEVSDYHYLDMKNVYYWAGPEFWKRPTGGVPKGKGKKLVGRKKNVNDINYNVDIVKVKDKWNKLFKKGQSLTRRTVASWKKRKLTLPLDLQIDNSVFLDLFHIARLCEEDDNPPPPQSPEFMSITLGNPDGSGDYSGSSRDNSQALTDLSSSQDPLNGAFYEGVDGPPGCSDALNDAFYDANMPRHPQTSQSQDIGQSGKVFKVMISPSNTPNFDQTSLVPAPKMVSFEPIKYKTRPIRVNMQHLKEVMLEVINEDIEEDEGSNNLDSAQSTPQTKFSRILERLSGRLERRTAADLSPAMAFLALLTLANENNLQLENNEDYSDVSVRFEDNPPNIENSNLSEKL